MSMVNTKIYVVLAAIAQYPTSTGEQNYIAQVWLCPSEPEHFSPPYEVAYAQAFYSSRSGSYNESQGPIGGLRAGKTLCCRAPPDRSSK
jgi:hypothetical protein